MDIQAAFHPDPKTPRAMNVSRPHPCVMLPFRPVSHAGFLAAFPVDSSCPEPSGGRSGALRHLHVTRHGALPLVASAKITRE
jgi:hypothetical protein